MKADMNELRVKVAEAAGWTRIHYKTAKADGWLAPGEQPKYPMDAVTGVFPKPRDERDSCPLDGMGMPDYPNSLDACAELRAGLTKKEQRAYGVALWKVAVFDDATKTEADFLWVFANATASDHCRAYLAAKGVSL